MRPADVNILVADDEPGIREMLVDELRQAGYRVAAAADGEEALAKARSLPFHLVISDVRMPRRDGVALLAELKQIDPDIEVILTTGYGTIDTAVAAMKQGAYDFLQKPYTLDAMRRTVEKALESRSLKTLVALYESSRAVFASVRLETLLPQITNLALRLLKADDASILLREGDRLYLAAAAGLTDDQGLQARLALGERVAGRLAEAREPAVLQGPLTDDPRFADLPPLREIASAIVHPLVLADETLGILCIHRTRTPGAFGLSDARCATVFASQIAQAVRNAQLVGSLEAKVRERDAACRRLEETQAQLIRAEKLATLGQIAGGIAHELNNPLTTILGFAQLLRDAPEIPPARRAALGHIEAQATRCARLVQTLATFSGASSPEPSPVRIPPLLDDALALLRYDLDRNGITLRLDIRDAPAIRGNAGQLQQVVLSLVTNALDAMAGSPERILEIGVRQQGGRVLLVVGDTGGGISRETAAHLFEPFFSTKPPGKGTGLGLFIANEIVHRHGGVLSVQSHRGQGTRFTVELPAAPEQDPPPRKPGQEPSS